MTMNDKVQLVKLLNDLSSDYKNTYGHDPNIILMSMPSFDHFKEMGFVTFNETFQTECIGPLMVSVDDQVGEDVLVTYLDESEIERYEL